MEYDRAMIHRVFAYGSNLDLDELRAWMRGAGYSPRALLGFAPARLPQHALIWDYYASGRAGGAANVAPRYDSVVPGGVLEVSTEGLAAIDRKEGVPIVYHRTLLDVEMNAGESPRFVPAWVYRVNGAYRRGRMVRPTRYYVGRLLAGADRFQLPIPHVESLRHLPTCD